MSVTELVIGGLTKESLIRRLVEAGVEFNDYAKTLFEHPDFAPTQTTEKVTITQLSLSTLQLDSPCSFEAIAARASDLGLQLCPLYLAAFMRMEALDRPEGPYLTIASPRPEKDEAYPTGFYLRNIAGVSWLRGYRVQGEAEWPVENEFVFVKPSRIS
jgi:hypothetical protein